MKIIVINNTTINPFMGKFLEELCTYNNVPLNMKKVTQRLW